MVSASARRRTGKWIVYTSADSVFQVAAHEVVVPLEELYRACEIARKLLVGAQAVSRVLARPFVGLSGAYTRTAHRRDFSLEPVGKTLLDFLAERGIPRVGIGKVDDLFAGRNITSEHTPTNADAYRRIEAALDGLAEGFVFVNVIEFDQSWGHRNDVPGFHKGLLELDAWIPRLETRVREDDLIILTADHGNDPTTPSTDHSREAVPVLALGGRVRPRAPRAASCSRSSGWIWKSSRRVPRASAAGRWGSCSRPPSPGSLSTRDAAPAPTGRPRRRGRRSGARLHRRPHRPRPLRPVLPARKDRGVRHDPRLGHHARFRLRPADRLRQRAGGPGDVGREPAGTDQPRDLPFQSSAVSEKGAQQHGHDDGPAAPAGFGLRGDADRAARGEGEQPHGPPLSPAAVDRFDDHVQRSRRA